MTRSRSGPPAPTRRGLQAAGVRVAQVSPGVVLVCIDDRNFGEHAAKAVTGLTSAERSVVELVACGWSNQRIAAERRTSTSTVANQLTAAYRKLGVASRRELKHSWAEGKLRMNLKVGSK